MRTSILAFCVLSALAANYAAAQPVPAAPTPVTIPLSKQIDFTASTNGRSYRLFVAIPFTPPPTQGYPVLYVLDGGAYFDSFADAARLRSALGDGIEPAVIVGIGYPGDDIARTMRERSFDLTPTQPDAATTARDAAAPGPVTKYGGADSFLTVIQTEIKPRIAAMLPIDPSRAMLFGHSLGGLFVLHALFTHPEDFSTWLALSPSIWWNNRAVLAEEPAFDQRLTANHLQPRIFLGVGALEQDVPKGPPPPGITREQIVSSVVNARMVSNVLDLATHLETLSGGPAYRVDYRVFDGQTHLSVPWTSLDAVLHFALKPTD
jgi:predicted alpha/beta superfamily hydrolase